MKNNAHVIHLLLIEDNPSDAELVSAELLNIIGEMTFQITWVDRLSKGLLELNKGDTDAVLLDLSLPDSQGLTTVTSVLNTVPHIPILVLSGYHDETLGLQIVQAGAQDYLVKGEVNRQAMARTIRYAIERKKAEVLLHAAEKRRDDRLEALQNLGNELATIREERIILETLVARAAKLAESPVCTVLMVNSTSHEAVLIAHVGLPTNILHGYKVSLDSPVFQESLSSGSAIIISDIDKEAPELRTLINNQEINSFYAYPMLRGNEVAGYITLSSLVSYLPLAGEIATYQLLADRAFATIENARLFEQTHRLAEQLALVNNIGQEIVYLTDTKSLLELATRRIVERLGHYAAGIFIFEGEKIIFCAGYAKYGVIPELGRLISLGRGITGRVASTGKPYLAKDVDIDPYYFYSEILPDTRCELAVPILSGGKPIGVIDIETESIDSLDEIDLHTVEAIAGQVATAYENSRLFDELNQRNSQMARLYRVSGSLLHGPNQELKILSRNIVETIQKEFPNTNSSLIIIQNETNELVRLAVAGPYLDVLHKCTLTYDGPGLIVKAIREGKTINSPNVLEHPDYLPSWEAARSELAIPLKIGAKVIGAIDIQSTQEAAFSPEEERLMTLFSDRVALALGHSQLYEQTVKNLQRLTALRTIDQAISSTIDLRVTLDILLEQIVMQLNVDAAAILLTNQRLLTLEFAVGRGFRTNAFQRIQWRLGEGLAGRAALERRKITSFGTLKLDESQYVSRNPHFVEEGFTSACAVPLIAKGQVQGVLTIFHRSILNPDQYWIDFLDTLADQAAIAIESVRLFESLQRSNVDLMMAYDATIEGWSRALDLRHKETEGHTQRVTDLTIRLATAMGIRKDNLVHLRRGALLHDIGKMGVSDSILMKPGPLTKEEMDIMRKHPTFAYELLSPISYLRMALDIPYYHHEKWDGTGYPRGLKGEQIPLAGRLFAVVDVWDALLSDRSYRSAWPEEKVREYIREQAGIHFDPHILDVFLSLMGKS